MAMITAAKIRFYSAAVGAEIGLQSFESLVCRFALDGGWHRILEVCARIVDVVRHCFE